MRQSVRDWEKEQIERDILVYQHYKKVRLVENIILISFGVILGLVFSYAAPLLLKLIGGM